MVGTKSTLGAKATKMLDYINHIIRVELEDGRSFVGQFLSYDVHMNVVLSHAKEIVTKGVRRDLPPLPNLPGEDITIEKQRGLVVIRGVTIVSIHICGPPPTKGKDEIPKQFITANFLKCSADSNGGFIPGMNPMMAMMGARPGMNMPGMMMPPMGMPGAPGAPGAPRPGMMPLPGGMMPPRPGMMPPPGGMMPPPQGMMPPPGGMMPPRPGMMPPPGGMMPPRPGMMPPPGGMMPPRPGMMPPPGGMMPPRPGMMIPPPSSQPPADGGAPGL